MEEGSPGISSVKSHSSNVTARKNSFDMKAGVFLCGVAGAAAIAGFSTTLAAAKNSDSAHFAKGVAGGAAEMQEAGTALALRALRRGTLYAVGGCGILFWAVWKLSGASTMLEFREKVGSCLPRIPKNDPPRGRTEFENLTDLLKYLGEGGHGVKHSPEDK
ncbi:transmembrane protein 242 [Bacillus rossius redtenbacheri]|uniref:transmembrane protein 242 n=1 Tax=Bacillus rossius redtenbacheri TaxID=93214 RepID=UPI002FDDA5CC